MNKTTLARLLESVFSGGEFSSKQNHIKNDQINLVLERLPFSLSKSQRDAIFRALQNDAICFLIFVMSRSKLN